MVDLPQIAKAAKDFACTLYRNQPGALIPTPMSDALHLVWDNICSYPGNPGLPTKPAPPIQGAQCPCVLYNVRIRFVFDGDTSPGEQPAVGTNDIQVFGAVGATRLVDRVVLPNGMVQARIEISCRGKSGENCTAQPVWRLAMDTITGYISHTVINMGRVDGGADNCGTLPDKFPDAPAPPPGGYLSPPVNFTFNDGSNIQVNFNLKPPLPPIAPVFNLPPVIINLIKPTANFDIPITFNFDGTVNFGKGGDGGDFSQDDRDMINNIKNVTNNLGDTVNNIQNDINNVTNYNNNKPPNPDDFELPPPPKPPGEHEKSYLAAVEINLIQIPRNAKTQSGDGAPNIVYAGWFEWRREGKYTPREPIHFQNSVFLAPKGIDGYAWTLYDGFTGTAQEIVNKEKV